AVVQAVRRAEARLSRRTKRTLHHKQGARRRRRPATTLTCSRRPRRRGEEDEGEAVAPVNPNCHPSRSKRSSRALTYGRQRNASQLREVAPARSRVQVRGRRKRLDIG